MRIRELGCLIAVAVAVVGPTQGAGPIDHAVVIDPCRSYPDEQASEAILIDLPRNGSTLEEDGWLWSDGVYSAAAWASLPGYETTHVFLGRGTTLEIAEFTEQGVIPDTIYVNQQSVDFAALAGIAGLEIEALAPGKYVAVEEFPGAMFGQAALYALARKGASVYVVAIDQQWLITGSAPTTTHVYGVVQLCSSPSDCDFDAALSLDVGDLSSPPDFTEELWIDAVQSFTGFPIHMKYRLERGVGATQYALAPMFGEVWEDGNNDPPLMPEHSGLVFADGSSDVYGIRKQPRKIRNLNTANESCALTGEPTDVAVWEPGIATVEPRYLLATTWDGTQGTIEIFSAGVCGSGSTASIPTGNRPTSLDVEVIDNDEIWIMVTTEGLTDTSVGDSLIEAIRVKVTASPVDAFSEIERHTLDAFLMEYKKDPGDPDVPLFDGSCPTQVVIGQRLNPPPFSYQCCVATVQQSCLPKDPRCPPPPE